MSGSLIDTLMAAHKILKEAGVSHALCGGLAANLYRTEVRATSDVDLVVSSTAVTVVDLVARFESSGWVAAPSWHQGEQIRLSHIDLGRVDLLIGGTEFEQIAVANAVASSISGIKVVTAEDLIVMKSVAGRARDTEAVVAILIAKGSAIDRVYVSAWVESFGATQTWERAQQDADREAD